MNLERTVLVGVSDFFPHSAVAGPPSPIRLKGRTNPCERRKEGRKEGRKGEGGKHEMEKNGCVGGRVDGRARKEVDGQTKGGRRSHIGTGPKNFVSRTSSSI